MSELSQTIRNQGGNLGIAIGRKTTYYVVEDVDYLLPA